MLNMPHSIHNWKEKTTKNQGGTWNQSTRPLEGQNKTTYTYKYKNEHDVNATQE